MVVEVLVMMELEALDNLQSVAEEEVSGVEANILSSVGVGDVDVGPRPGLVPGGSLVELEMSTVCTGDLLQPNPGGCNLHYSTSPRYLAELH